MPQISPLTNRLKDATIATWHLGLTCFGGPPVHFRIFHTLFVQKLQWIDEQMYQEFFSISQALPGPASTKMLFCIVQMHDGLLASILAFFYWSIPGAVGMYGLSLGIAAIQDTLPDPVYPLLSGLNAATTGVIALAAIELSEKAVTDRLTRIILSFSAFAALLYSAIWYLPVLMVISGSATLLYDLKIIHKVLRKARQAIRARLDHPSDQVRDSQTVQESQTQLSQQATMANGGILPTNADTSSVGTRNEVRVIPRDYPLTLRWRSSAIVISSFVVAFVVIMVLRAVLSEPPVLYRMFSNLWLAGTIIFGGGPVVIPLLREYIVAEGWVPPRDFLIGLAVIQAFPGPNFNFAVFLGSLTAVNNATPSIVGAAVGFVAIFTPGMVLVHGTMGIWPALRNRPWVKSLVRGVSTSAVGFIFTAVYRIWQIGLLEANDESGKSLGNDPWWLVVAGTAFVGGRYFRIPPPLCICLGAIMGLGWFGVVSAWRCRSGIFPSNLTNPTQNIDLASSQYPPPTSNHELLMERDIQDGTAKFQRPVVRHSRSSTKVLKAWFISHSSWPYPSQDEKDTLSSQTGMTVRQISHWFVNARRRHGDKLSNEDSAIKSPHPSPISRSAPTSIQSKRGGSNRSHDSPHRDMTPFDRWRHSPPEDDHVPLQAIAQAAQDSVDISKTNNDAAAWIESVDSASSLGSFDFSSSNASSGSSAYSHGSFDLTGSLYSLGGRSRGRKRHQTTRSTRRRAGKATKEERLYQCTFCTDRFKTRYEWTRHEGTLHLALEKWTCLPFGPLRRDPANDTANCAFCGMLDPDQAHLNSHRAAECIAKPPEARTFFRKDHLRQHLRLIHGVPEVRDWMSTWRFKEVNIKSRCGFCEETFTSWPDRNDHICDHFREGAQMIDWKGCRGLEPAVALLVENAMPPYLIGLESTDAEPFSASRGTTKKISAMNDGNACQPSPTSFESLTARIGDYVRIARENGLDLSDEALRRQARLILYDDDDPLNHTPADNAQWLAMFKLGYGLQDSPSATQLNSNQQLMMNTNASSLGPTLGPFTLQKLQQAAGHNQAMLPSNLDVLPDGFNTENWGASNMQVPWSWQTPECLAEFSQLCQQPDSTTACQRSKDDSLGLFPEVGGATGLETATMPASLTAFEYASTGGGFDHDEMPLDMRLLFESEFDV
ncbi:unnamed protein product [Clonostachys byssicola]|uniref:Homeobox domain-containing protein n=1 Tax=Clonostachys byssicola TaxID=160290 RepID=A0A9N9UFB5_9HYPO|nr:unnamed protein product [Clonostachys byssicola]